MNLNKSIQMIEELSNAYGASGFEDCVVEIGKKFGKETCDIQEDSLRNLYLNRKKNTGNKPIVMLDGHSDELGFIVQAIKPNGTLRFLELGSWVRATIAGQKVKVLNSEGIYITGVIGAKPPHFMTDKEKTDSSVNVSELSIDIGAISKEDAINNFKICIGQPVVPAVEFEFNSTSGTMIGKGFDCRLGCSAVIDTINQLENENLNVDVVGVFATQEEVGTRGSNVSVRKVKPDIAIVFEGTPSDDTVVEDYMIQAQLKNGAQLRLMDKSMIGNPRFAKFAQSIATINDIDFQLAIRSGGGTNGGVIHLAEEGIPTIVIGVPVRYAHTPYGISSIKDYECAVRWATEIVKALTEDIINSF